MKLPTKKKNSAKTKTSRKKPVAAKPAIKLGRGKSLKTKGAVRMRRQSYVLNDKEQKVWAAFGYYTPGDETFLSLHDLAARAFNKRGTTPKTKGNSWVRNSMRKLVRLGLVKGKGGKAGLYARTKLDPDSVLAKAERDGLIKPEAFEGEVAKPAKKAAAKVAKAAKSSSAEPKKKSSKKKNQKASEEEGEIEVETSSGITASVELEEQDGADIDTSDDDDYAGNHSRS